jgi:hypothetical protein
MLLRALLISVLACGIATAVNAQQLTPLQRGQQTVLQSQAFQAQMQAQRAEMENYQLQMQMRQYQMQAAGAAIDESLDHLAHACDPNVVRQPGVHLLARLGLCGEHQVEQHRPVPQAQGRIVQQGPEMKNGPRSVFDRAGR